ncbi:TldD/PmbA family protein [Clostridium tagluense]|uniref:TldD/PmbA family protein n=1 Tax=Clostridium tagluense TaxID=360422 RepID=UPI001CF38F27|nr:TldD/PmbA family protein [Clostridium tagluense]MCB2299177.1 TldD/PmbA family protein [Clostridium tagluense]
MTLNEFVEKLFKRAKEACFSEYEIYYESGESLDIEIFKKEVDKYSLNKTMGISFRGIYEGKMGYSYTEIMDDQAIELLIEKAKSNAQIIENEEKEIIFEGSNKYEDFNGYNEEIKSISPEDKIKLAMALEDEAYKCSEYVENTGECSLGTTENERRIINSKGLDISTKVNGIYGFMEPVVTKEGKTNNSYAYKFTNDMSEFDIKKIARESVDESLAYFDAESVKTGKYRVMFKNSVSAEFLQTFEGIFSADNTQKGLSLLKGKVGETIASESLTIVDNPFLKGSLCCTPFDAEGVATYCKNIVEKGKLKTLLHNLKTATVEGVVSTGNASKASFTSLIKVAPTTLYIEKGIKSYEDMIKALDNGIIITEVQGTHSGANPISGDFSLAAKGFLVENGKIIRPVEQITIAGNYFEVMKDTLEVGCDFKLGIPRLGSCFGSPCVLIREISVAGL